MELPECDWLIQEQWDEIVLKFNYIRFVGHLIFIDDKITKFRKERQCDWCHEKTIVGTYGRTSLCLFNNKKVPFALCEACCSAIVLDSQYDEQTKINARKSNKIGT